MRAIWKGSISFGLVYIPIGVYPATREEKLSFRQLRVTDHSPINYKKVAQVDGKEVPADQIVRGYPLHKGEFVVLQDEDFEKVKLESTHSIDISDFVEENQVDPKYFYKPYFLEPQKGGEKAYALLHKALSGTGKIGIAKVVIHNREHLAAVKPDGSFLILELMHFAQELLDASSLQSAAGKDVTEKEVTMAKTLIETMTVPWEPEKYHDEYRRAVLEMIEDKAANKLSPNAAPKPRQPAEVIDLLSVLQASLNKNNDLRKGSREKATTPGARRTRVAATRTRRQVAA